VRTISRSNKAQLKQKIAPMLDALGHDPAAVAEALTTLEFRGRRGSSTDCVVARYLQAMTDDDPAIRCIVVSTNAVRVRSTSSWRFDCRVPLPQAVRSFIWGFDRGRYLELVGDSEPRTGPSQWWPGSDLDLGHDQPDPEPETSGSLVGVGAQV